MENNIDNQMYDFFKSMPTYSTSDMYISAIMHKIEEEKLRRKALKENITYISIIAIFIILLTVGLYFVFTIYYPVSFASLLLESLKDFFSRTFSLLNICRQGSPYLIWLLVGCNFVFLLTLEQFLEKKYAKKDKE